jgi:hypothetical protein
MAELREVLLDRVARSGDRFADPVDESLHLDRLRLHPHDHERQAEHTDRRDAARDPAPSPGWFRRAEPIVNPMPLSKPRPRIMVGTYGSEAIAKNALAMAKEVGAALVVCFVRQVSLSYKYEGGATMSIDTDLAAQKTFARFLEMGHEMSVPIVPVYDQGQDAAELMAEAAAMNGCEKVIIGTSRRGVLYHMVKGSFQRHLEGLLPPEIGVSVIGGQTEQISGQIELGKL